MFSFEGHKEPPSKCYVTYAKLPKYIDAEQPPIKRKPFSTIINQAFNHAVDLILPEELYNTIWQCIGSEINHVQYSEVFLPLSALLEGDFFNTYIKSGNILMLSEGRPGIDNLYCLKDGKKNSYTSLNSLYQWSESSDIGLLRLELFREIYERTGLMGKPIRDGGRKHMKTRYAVEINLRLPSMLHGKKGFERIVWAFKNVLNHSVAWLFYDFEGKSDRKTVAASRPIERHHPITRVCEPIIVHLRSVLVPSIESLHRNLSLQGVNIGETATDLLEWLDLISLESSRVRSDDTVDPYLCRYSVPESDMQDSRTIVKVTWKGFLPAIWVRTLFLELLKLTKAPQREGNWFALSIKAFETEAVGGYDGYTILRLPSVLSTASDEDASAVDYVIWEMVTSP